MKLNLTFLLILCFTLFTAQNKKSDSVAVQHDKENLIHSGKSIQNNDHAETSNEVKSDKEKTIIAQNIDIVREINAVLNYKINRVWRRDLYCFACENYTSGKIA